MAQTECNTVEIVPSKDQLATTDIYYWYLVGNNMADIGHMVTFIALHAVDGLLSYILIQRLVDDRPSYSHPRVLKKPE